MLFAITTIIALAASASAAAVPRATEGTWSLYLDATAENLQSITAVLTTDEHPEGKKASCIFNPTAKPFFYGCDQKNFNFQFDGETVKLMHTVETPSVKTYFGEKKLNMVYSDYYKRFEADDTVVAYKVLA